jgi:peptide/nickel transport system substrate-binding protein
MKQRKRTLRFVAGALTLALVAAACGGDDDDPETSGSDGETTTTEAVEVPEGGELVIGAEQQPDCMAWILSCAGSSWGYWSANVHTMPRVYDTVKEGDAWVAKPSALVTGEPEVDLSDPEKPVVTYSINPEAKWNDDTPVSCDDFEFTWRAIATGEDVYDPTGYVDIEAVECPDPQTAVVKFSKVFGGWKALFGGGYGIHPAHILDGKSMEDEMASGYEFSAGPWVIESWEKDVEWTLVPNENYWGDDKAKLDKVIFRLQADTTAQFTAFKAGETSVIYPQPQIDAVEQIEAGIEGAQSEFSANTGNLEALWINNAAFPFEDVAVRQAFAYAIDREAIVEALFGPLGVEGAMQTLNPPILSEFADTEAFAGYTQDQAKVDELMEGAGWARNADGFWEKDGEQADIEIKSTLGNRRREVTVTELISQLGESGFNVTFNPQDAGALFGEQGPAGDFQVALYAQVLTFISPGQCNLFCAKNIPSAENDNAGQNWTRTDIPELDEALEALDATLDEAEQAELGKQADAIQAEQMVSLPLDPLPNILLWSDSVVGPVSDNPVLGPFWQLSQWGLAA